MHYADDIESQGFAIVPDVLSEIERQALSKNVVAQFSSNTSYHPRSQNISRYASRAHIPMPLDELAWTVMENVVEKASDDLKATLGATRELVELSSLTVFPGAQAQEWHPDVTGNMLSVFVSLVPTEQDVGALEVIPGSHTSESHPDETRGVALEVPAGSAVLMRSSLWHRGGANRSVDRIRPIFYFTLGDPSLEGPTYSIRESLRGAHRMDDFERPPGRRRFGWNPGSVPVLAPGRQITQSLDGSQLLLIGPSGIADGLHYTTELGWLKDVLANLHSVRTVEDIATCLERPVENVVAVLSQLGRDGWVCH